MSVTCRNIDHFICRLHQLLRLEHLFLAACTAAQPELLVFVIAPCEEALTRERVRRLLTALDFVRLSTTSNVDLLQCLGLRKGRVGHSELALHVAAHAVEDAAIRPN